VQSALAIAQGVPRDGAPASDVGSGDDASPTGGSSITGSVAPPGPDDPDDKPDHNMSEEALAKLDQIKDLLLTAEAIGEENLDRHFEQVSQRQRELIKEFFARSGPEVGASGPDASGPDASGPDASGPDAPRQGISGHGASEAGPASTIPGT
jgi:hypothetical protein